MRRGLRAGREARGSTPGSFPSAFRAVLLVAGLALFAAALAAEPPGRVEGRVTRLDGTALGGVTVAVANVPRPTEITDRQGRFRVDNLSAGTYTFVFSLAGEIHYEEGVAVAAGETTRIEPVLDWRPSFAETLTVYAASRRLERIVEAPAAVSILGEAEIARQAATGQLPKLFEFTNGVEVSQSGLYDFKLNVRGVNLSVNRRVAVLIDGRDPSLPLLGSQEWAAVAFPLDDLAQAELVRGPSSALYGANAFNGIINLTTKAPRDSQGGFVRLTGGELSTVKLDLRTADQLADNLFYKVVAGYTESDDFYRSRTATVEYSRPCNPPLLAADCVYLEAAAPSLDRDKIAYLSGRLDRYFDSGGSLTVEAGTAEIEGYILSAPGARFQIVDLSRPWGRFNLNARRWNLLATYTGRKADAPNLAAATPAFTDNYRASLEFQTHGGFGGGRGRIVGGLWAATEKIDTAGPDGVQTLLPEAKNDDLEAVFGQVDWDVNDKLRLVAALRFDDSQLYDLQFSPRASLVWAPRADQTLRFSYNEGFLRPNYPEYFVRVPVAPALDLTGLEGFCAPVGVDCGFGRPVPFLVVGNEDLRVETIRSFEIGYNRAFGGRAFLTVDAYLTEIEDFVQQFVPQLGTRLGRVNPRFGPYLPPPALPPALAAGLLATLQALQDVPGLGPFIPFLSSENGQALFALNTAVNFGKVETRGVEVAIDYDLGSGWSLFGNYNWFEFKVRDELAEAPLRPNGPEHKISTGLAYAGDRLSGSLRYRWVDDFAWAEGILIGSVPSYNVVNLTGAYQLSPAWEIGINVSNLLDSEHYEVFSGDILERRALAHVSYSWR